jgi:ubiquinone/menaquinone biosynthesis C-methylase UbiE
MSFENTSHVAHEAWYDKQFPSEQARMAVYENWQKQIQDQTIGNWLQAQMLQLTDVLALPQTRWLTVGDGYGFDGHYLHQRNCIVTASDISDTFLPLAKKINLIHDYAIENAEKLSFADNVFDYTLCKESYHHFPRPYMAVYEMLRVSKKAVILIEPHDPMTKMPLLLALGNILDRINPKLLEKYWKNRYSFEEVGNYVFKLSERETEKLAMGLNLPAVAFKGINNHYFDIKTASQIADENSAGFRKIIAKRKYDDLLARLSLMPHQLLCAVIFKTLPELETIQALKKEGFRYYAFPPNPYLK